MKQCKAHSYARIIPLTLAGELRHGQMQWHTEDPN